ncbi:MAG: DUF2924 domain-containing protein [Magnetococcales bacterium]|nr:DUF2924 domain-containing protein [Magnetococcales bacterium]
MQMNVIKRVTALPGMSIKELRQMWMELNSSDPPPYNKAFLVRRLAYRIQELAYGGLSSIAVARLDEIADSGHNRPNRKIGIPGDGPLPGTRLLRTWKGVEHCVTVLEDGFEHQGRRFKSLSAAAKAITGTNWNGRIFFYGNRGKRKEK